MEKTSVQRILIIKLSSLGDIINCLPIPPALKSLYPSAQISFLVNRQYGELLAGNPFIDKILYFDRYVDNNFFTPLISIGKLIKQIRKKDFDLVIDLQGLLRSGLIAWFARGKKIIGFENAREGSRFFYDERIPVQYENIHAVDRYLLVPKALGWNGRPSFDIRLESDDELFIEHFFKAEKIKPYLKIVGIQSGARWKTKQWSAAKIAKLGDLIEQTGQYQVVLLGSKEETIQADEIVHRMKYPPFIAAGKFSLKQLAVFLKKCRMLITTDSGPMHLAAALDVPVLALFGATDFHLTGPYGSEHRVIHKKLSCSPCLRRRCLNISYPMECMEAITPEEVFEKFREMEKLR